MLELSCTNEEKIPVTLAPVTGAGKPAPLDGPVVITVQSGEGTVNVLNPEGTSFEVVSGDNPGDTAFLVSADADLGSGIETISDVILLHVAGAKALSLGMEAGAAVLK